MTTRRTILLTLAASLALLGIAGALFVRSGMYDVGATTQHTQPVYTLLEYTMRQSVRLRARGIELPALDAPALVMRGAGCFRLKCEQCHGAPGVAQADIGRSMQPLPGPLVDAHQRWTARELYWITTHGIRMSGMPAWQHRLSNSDRWALVAFMLRLPSLGSADYARLTHADAKQQPCELDAAERNAVPERAPDAERGKALLTQYACSTCHTIPGVTGSFPHVGPPLAGIGARERIAGRLANTPTNMVRWLREPHRIDPQTTMPDLAVTEADARDIAAYLAGLR